MNELIERYLYAALEHVPEGQRADVSREIRTAIDEMVEQRIDAGEPRDAAVRSALNELGDPQRFAASYDERPRYLIGPAWYPKYIKALKLVTGVVLPVVILISLLVGAAEGDSVGAAIGSAVESVLWTVGMLLFWITLAFAVAERTTPQEKVPAGRGSWSVDDLPTAPAPRQITLGDTLPSLIALVLFGGLAVIQHTQGVGFFLRGVVDGYEHLPVLNPELGIGWTLPFFGLLALSIMIQFVKHVGGRWTRNLMLATVIESALWIAYIIALAVSEPIVNPELARRIDENATWWETADRANTIIAIAIIAITLQDLWEAWRGYRASRAPGGVGAMHVPA